LSAITFFRKLDRETRKKIIETIVLKRGGKKVAEDLGVSKAAISRYLKGEIFPSDKILSKIFEISDKEEREKISIIIGEYIVDLLKEYKNLFSSLEKDTIYKDIKMKIFEELESLVKELKSECDQKT
jgi:transcriptional regulator with XRE-family HTH domain